MTTYRTLTYQAKIFCINREGRPAIVPEGYCPNNGYESEWKDFEANDESVSFKTSLVIWRDNILDSEIDLLIEKGNDKCQDLSESLYICSYQIRDIEAEAFEEEEKLTLAEIRKLSPASKVYQDIVSKLGVTGYQLAQAIRGVNKYKYIVNKMIELGIIEGVVEKEEVKKEIKKVKKVEKIVEEKKEVKKELEVKDIKEMTLAEIRKLSPMSVEYQGLVKTLGVSGYELSQALRGVKKYEYILERLEKI